VYFRGFSEVMGSTSVRPVPSASFSQLMIHIIRIIRQYVSPAVETSHQINIYLRYLLHVILRGTLLQYTNTVPRYNSPCAAECYQLIKKFSAFKKFKDPLL
jgi:hypothetical protein